MSANRSAAVMQQRREPADSLDDFPTPPWATRALCERLPLGRATVWEPACNRGHMARPLAEYARRVIATDVRDYGWDGQDGVCDFLMGDVGPVDWVITNPPFRLAEEFVRTGLSHARVGVAVFVRLSFLEGQGRAKLFEAFPPHRVLVFCERVALFKGALLDPDVAVWRDGQRQYPASATSYCWIVWQPEAPGHPRIEWIAEARRALTRAGDYPPVPAHLRPPQAAAPLLEREEGSP